MPLTFLCLKGQTKVWSIFLLVSVMRQIQSIPLVDDGLALEVCRCFCFTPTNQTQLAINWSSSFTGRNLTQTFCKFIQRDTFGIDQSVNIESLEAKLPISVYKNNFLGWMCMLFFLCSYRSMFICDIELFRSVAYGFTVRAHICIGKNVAFSRSK